MFKISLKKVFVLSMLSSFINNHLLNATPMSPLQNQNCLDIALASEGSKVAAYKKFVESLTDSKTKIKLKHHGEQSSKHYKDINNASRECLNKFCESINTSRASLSIQEALNKAYREEIEACDA